MRSGSVGGLGRRRDQYPTVGTISTEQAMAFDVETKDCTGLSDGELAQMADLCADREPRFDIGFLSKQRDEWVLVTSVREGSKLRAYGFCTLERIGGTPSLLVGVASVEYSAKSEPALRAMMADLYRRAVLAFPDEDVLVGTRLLSASGYAIFHGLSDVVPLPQHKATGEERAWGRRLAKRFGAENRIDDRTFVISGDEAVTGGVDFSGPKVKAPSDELAALFAAVDPSRGDRLVGFGWAMAEDLASGSLAAGKAKGFRL